MKQAFTLIELLIVVAIIGILAAIAVPNFLNAQIRAKVANTQSDMRSLHTALEQYRIDNNMYPPTPSTAGNLRYARLAKLTSPVPYMSTVPLDPFRKGVNPNAGEVYRPENSAYPLWEPEYADARRDSGQLRHLDDQKSAYGKFLLHGACPDSDYEAAEGTAMVYYDSSNGIKSSGDWYR
ncbi:prepilin-type N-terminal cleavage/methylation domain-containing protein [bacterium]|nr:prepilin-type N-terminal cleavage/methylation domain-containing protein [bacterium]